MRRIVTPLNEKRIRHLIMVDLIRYDLLRCKTISVQRRTRPLTKVRLHRAGIAEHETITCETEHAR